MLPFASREVEVTRVSLRLENGCDKDRVTQHELVIDRPGRLVGLKFKHQSPDSWQASLGCLPHKPLLEVLKVHMDADKLSEKVCRLLFVPDLVHVDGVNTDMCPHDHVREG